MADYINSIPGGPLWPGGVKGDDKPSPPENEDGLPWAAAEFLNACFMYGKPVRVGSPDTEFDVTISPTETPDERQSTKPN